MIVNYEEPKSFNLHLNFAFLKDGTPVCLFHEGHIHLFPILRYPYWAFFKWFKKNDDAVGFRRTTTEKGSVLGYWITFLYFIFSLEAMQCYLYKVFEEVSHSNLLHSRLFAVAKVIEYLFFIVSSFVLNFEVNFERYFFSVCIVEVCVFHIKIQ